MEYPAVHQGLIYGKKYCDTSVRLNFVIFCALAQAGLCRVPQIHQETLLHHDLSYVQLQLPRHHLA